MSRTFRVQAKIRCRKCQDIVFDKHLTPEGRCPSCGNTLIPPERNKQPLLMTPAEAFSQWQERSEEEERHIKKVCYV